MALEECMADEGLFPLPAGRPEDIVGEASFYNPEGKAMGSYVPVRVEGWIPEPGAYGADGRLQVRSYLVRLRDARDLPLGEQFAVPRNELVYC